MDLNAFSKSDITWIRNSLALLSAITRVAGIQQVFIVKFALGMAVLWREVIDVPISYLWTPLFSSKTKYTTKAKFITQPVSI